MVSNPAPTRGSQATSSLRSHMARVFQSSHMSGFSLSQHSLWVDHPQLTQDGSSGMSLEMSVPLLPFRHLCPLRGKGLEHQDVGTKLAQSCSASTS